MGKESRIRPNRELYDPSLGATHYIGKYVARKFSDWDLSENLLLERRCRL